MDNRLFFLLIVGNESEGGLLTLGLYSHQLKLQQCKSETEPMIVENELDRNESNPFYNEYQENLKIAYKNSTMKLEM